MKILSEYILNMGIDRFGFCKVDDFYAVVMLFPYYTKKEDNSNMSVYAYSEDYHIITRRYLEKVAQFIKNQGDYKTDIYVDVSPYNDVMLGFNAGLGVVGENGLLINDKYGTFHFIGYVITDMSLEISKPLKNECMKCGKCIKNCPTGALKNKDFSICLSHITQKKGELTQDEKKLIKENKSAFGCDICQMVCPMNDFRITPLEDFKENRITKIKKSDFEDISNKEFKEKYQNRAFSWRGKQVLIRNLDILEN